MPVRVHLSYRAIPSPRFGVEPGARRGIMNSTRRCKKVAVLFLLAVTAFTSATVVYFSPSLTTHPSSLSQLLGRGNRLYGDQLANTPRDRGAETIRSRPTSGNAADNRTGSIECAPLTGCGGVDDAPITWKQGQVTELRPRISKSCEKLALNVPQEKTRVRLPCVLG